MTQLKVCSCKHEFQDKRYGYHQRIHNEQEGKNKGKLRCTVCGTSR